MVTVKSIYDLIDAIAPFRTQMSFDNAGLLIGDASQSVEKILVSLDVTEEVAEEAAQNGCQLIVSHHPVIFHPLKRITVDDPVARTVMSLVINNISAICCHTNLDMADGGVNDCLAAAAGLIGCELLAEEGVSSDGVPYGCGRIGTLKCGEMPLTEYLKYISKSLKPNGIRYVDAGKYVHKVAVGGGACADYMMNALDKGCDTFITSDVKYNGFLDAKDYGINLIDAGHFPTENVVIPQLMKWICDTFPEVSVIETKVHHEVFQYFIEN